MGNDLLLLVLGLALLVVGGEAMVRGATGLARGLGISPLAIGLTVVAFGTSAPELGVNVTAAWRDLGAIGFGNIVGSNMANIGLIVGCAALIKPIQVRTIVIRREIPMMLLATAAFSAMALDRVLSGTGAEIISRADGLVLLLLFVVFLYYTIGDLLRQRAESNRLAQEAQEEARTAPSSVWGNVALSFVGLLILVWGADFTVDSGASLARALGVSEVVIGLTLVAIGTSLPELAASTIAARRGHADLAIGNVVGSNIFNLLLVGGVTALVRPIPVPPGGYWDVGMMIVLSVLLLMLSRNFRQVIVRTEAIVLMTIYVSYLVWRSGALPF